MEPYGVSYCPWSDPAANQMEAYKKNHQNTKITNITTLGGRPVGSITNILTAGPHGPLLAEDTTWFEEITHFNRERIPERVVHAKGAGAFGTFEVTNTQITQFSSAALFSRLGQKTPVAVRFSTVIREQGSADTIRDARGFAVRFYTEEGNLDLVGINNPVFFVRDPFQFSRFIHCQKRNPATNLFDNNARWDYLTLRPEVMHAITWTYGTHGIPDGYRHMNAWVVNTYKLVNSRGHPIYNKFCWRTGQGVVNLDNETANRLVVSDPDFGLHDLYDAIERKQYPTWMLYIQVMTYEQARTWEYNPFDATKIWPEDQFPLIEVGRLTLNRNPSNFFADIDQLAFTPGNRVPGIEFSPDRILQSRVFAYSDAARHRIGPNFHLIDVNRPVVPVLTPTFRDGPMRIDSNQADSPNYYPSSFSPNVQAHPELFNEHRQHLEATDVDRFVSDCEDNYTQVRDLYLSYTGDERKQLYSNIAAELGLTYNFIQRRALGHFEKIHSEYAEGVRQAIEAAKQDNGSF